MKTIAIADAHEAVRNTLAGLLSRYGYRVVGTFANGQQLIDFVENATTAPELCIIDWEMPVLNGYDTARCIKSKWYTIKVLVYTLKNDQTYIDEIYDSGADAYCTKGSDFNDLIFTIRRLLNNTAMAGSSSSDQHP